MALPSDRQFRQEIARLSLLLYSPIGSQGEVAPTREAYDNFRDPKWSQSRSLLLVFGLPVNSVGWQRLVQAYGFSTITLSEVRSADHGRRGHIVYLTRSA